MAGNLGEYLRDKADELDVGRADALQIIQIELERRYPEKTRALALHQGKLRVITPNASVAGDLRLRQLDFLEIIRMTVPTGTVIERLIIQIRSLN